MELDRARKFLHSIENEEQKQESESTGSLSSNSRSSLQRVSPFFPPLCVFISKRLILSFFDSSSDKLTWPLVDTGSSVKFVHLDRCYYKEKPYCIRFFTILASINFNLISHWSDQFVFVFLTFELFLFF